MIIIKDKKLLGTRGFNLNHHIKGGDVVIIPLHTKDCVESPTICSCGAIEAMPESVVNCEITWPDWRRNRRRNRKK